MELSIIENLSLCPLCKSLHKNNVHMVWDNGRTLALCPGYDQFVKIDGIEVKEEDTIVDLDDQVFAVVPSQVIDCSRLGFFDEFEEDSWNLIRQYLATVGVKLLPNEDGEQPISYYHAKEVQDKIIELLKEMGVKMDFGENIDEEQDQEQVETEEIKMGVMQ